MEIEDERNFSLIRPLEGEAAAEYERFVDLVNDTFGSHAIEDEDFAVLEEGGSMVDVRLFINNYRVLAAPLVRKLVVKLRDELGRFSQYWQVHIFVYRPENPYDSNHTALWLTVDRYSIFEYRGQVKSERFSSIEEFESFYWVT
jgi:hypothetical protein